MRTSLKTLALVAMTVALFGINQTASAAISFDINVSRGPVYAGSLTNYVGNALNVTFGGPQISGSETQPYNFALLGDTVEATDFIVTSNNGDMTGGFASWLGQANPTGNFSQEVGNRLYFASTWITSATPITLSNLTFLITSAPNPILNQTLVYGDLYPQGIVARNWGSDGVPGTGDDIEVGQGDSATGLMNDIVVYLGIGNGVNAVNAPGATSQEKIDNTVNAILHGGAPGSGLEGGIDIIIFTAAYNDDANNIHESSSKFLTMNGYSVPEPASLVLFGIGVVTLATRRHTQTM